MRNIFVKYGLCIAVESSFDHHLPVPFDGLSSVFHGYWTTFPWFTLCACWVILSTYTLPESTQDISYYIISVIPGVWLTLASLSHSNTPNCLTSTQNCRTATINCLTAILNFQTTTLHCRTVTSNCRTSAINCRMDTLNWRKATLNCRMDTLNWHTATLNCQMDTLNWRTATFERPHWPDKERV